MRIKMPRKCEIQSARSGRDASRLRDSNLCVCVLLFRSSFNKIVMIAPNAMELEVYDAVRR